jgi:hypothetical protein
MKEQQPFNLDGRKELGKLEMSKRSCTYTK